MKTLIFFVFITILTAGEQTLADNNWFSDNFNDSVINTTNWECGGDGISERYGGLDISRNSPDDYIQTASTYSGNFVINFDIRVHRTDWNDPFHGVTISDGLNLLNSNGVSMGFSMSGSLFCMQQEIDSSSFIYGGANLNGRWQHWTFTKNGNNLSILVNGAQLKNSYGRIFGGIVPDTVRVYFPGIYLGDDGNGHASSSIDNFSISSVPEPCTLLLFGLGAAIAVRKR